MGAERLHKLLASAGVASRRDCEALIAAGRVKVNGQVVQEPGTRADFASDQVLVDDQPVQPPGARVYILLHKPVGVVSTADDPQGRPTVVDLVASAVRVFPVGRLDANSEGLLLLTNDGELAHSLTHPRFAVEKEYQVLLDRAPSDQTLQQWQVGVVLDGQPTAPAHVEPLTPPPDANPAGAWVRVVLREGRKRQIREVARLLGHTVRRLIRVREGELVLGSLPAGAWRPLAPHEVRALRSHVRDQIGQTDQADQNGQSDQTGQPPPVSGVAPRSTRTGQPRTNQARPQQPGRRGARKPPDPTRES